MDKNLFFLILPTNITNYRGMVNCNVIDNNNKLNTDLNS